MSSNLSVWGYKLRFSPADAFESNKLSQLTCKRCGWHATYKIWAISISTSIKNRLEFYAEESCHLLPWKAMLKEQHSTQDGIDSSSSSSPQYGMFCKSHQSDRKHFHLNLTWVCGHTVDFGSWIRSNFLSGWKRYNIPKNNSSIFDRFHLQLPESFWLWFSLLIGVERLKAPVLLSSYPSPGKYRRDSGLKPDSSNNKVH